MACPCALLQDDPWLQKVGALKEGMLVEGTITHLTKFGAFARIGDDLEGLIHVSELSDQRIGHPKEVVKEGETRTLRVIKIDAERRRIGLSLRKVDSPAYADLDWKMALSDEVQKAGTDEPEALEELVAEESPVAAQEPVVEEPVVEEPVVEEPVAEEPVAEEPAVEEPIAEEPVVEELVAEEPVTEEPATEETPPAEE